MDSAAPRWYIRIPIDPARWEFVQADLYGYPVEAIVESETEALVYFAALGDATEAAKRFGAEAPARSSEGGGEVFGDGEHPTTSLCLRLLTQFLRAGDRVADIGSGTGVLSRAAAELGAAFVAACDIDAPAPRATKLTMSGLRAGTVHGGADCFAEASFDLVVTNLHMAALRDAFDDIRRISRPGARIAVSGLLGEQRAEGKAMLETRGWAVVAEIEFGGWIGLAGELRPVLSL